MFFFIRRAQTHTHIENICANVGAIRFGGGHQRMNERGWCKRCRRRTFEMDELLSVTLNLYTTTSCSNV